MKTKPHPIQTQVISKRLQEEFEQFLEYAPAKRLSNNLRNLLLWYLLYAKGEYSINMDDLLTDLTWLFALLDTADEELQP